MKLSHISSLGCGLILALALGSTRAAALPSIDGGINFDGTAMTDTGSLDTATAFTSISNTFVDPNTTSGSYVSVPPMTSVAFSSFSFNSGSVTPLWSFTSGGTTYSFAATSIVINSQSSSFLNLSGDGIASITGFADTAGTWTITDTGNAPTFTFGSGTTVRSGVPDSGATALLIALGLLAAGLGVKFYGRQGPGPLLAA